MARSFIIEQAGKDQKWSSNASLISNIHFLRQDRSAGQSAVIFILFYPHCIMSAFNPVTSKVKITEAGVLEHD